MRQIALLRRINVGGNNMIKMAELKLALGKLGYDDIATCIQSGNIAFNSEEQNTTLLATQISDCINTNFKLIAPCIVLPKDTVKTIVANMPFVPTVNKFLHFTFFDQAPSSEKQPNFIKAVTPTDECLITTEGAYVHCPNGYSKTKLIYQLFEKTFGLTAAARKWNSCLKLCEL
jgi:uncharacterized protein (DUF1697 family)